jgi:hypothetical protein
MIPLRKYLEKLWFDMMMYLPTLFGLLVSGREKANGIIFSQ